MIKIKPLLFLILLSVFDTIGAQNKKKDIIVSFYNLENLFDTINNDNVRDNEFTPCGSKHWDSERYNTKLTNIVKVLVDIGSLDGYTKGPDILGLCEIENKNVLLDLTNHENLKKYNYNIIHQDSPDKRGIDVALLYKGNKFSLLTSKVYPLYLYNSETGERIHTRDQLLVSGKIKKLKIHLIVSHWPSRFGGELKSRPLRLEAAKLTRHIVDSLIKDDSEAKVIILGDFNDNPDNSSLAIQLNAGMHGDSLNHGQLFNCSGLQYLNDQGSIMSRGKWHMFDQILITQSFLSRNANFTYSKFAVHNKKFLIQQQGRYSGYPFRTYGGNKYLGGYSDHLPVYLILSRE